MRLPAPALAPPRTRRHAALVALVVPALLLSGCGDAGETSQPEPVATESSPVVPAGDVEVPEGVDLTEAGAELPFGQPATVAYEANARRKSVLSLTVESVREGRIADFSSYQLDATTKRSRPYYAEVSAKNVGDGDLSRVTVPLFAVDDRNVLIQPSTFSNTFKRCPSRTLPAGFGTGRSVSGCLVYLVPNGGTLVAMSYRPLQAFEPITWDGTVAPPAKDKKKASKKASKQDKKSTRKSKP